MSKAGRSLRPSRPGCPVKACRSHRPIKSRDKSVLMENRTSSGLWRDVLIGDRWVGLSRELAVHRSMTQLSLRLNILFFGTTAKRRASNGIPRTLRSFDIVLNRSGDSQHLIRPSMRWDEFEATYRMFRLSRDFSFQRNYIWVTDGEGKT